MLPWWKNKACSIYLHPYVQGEVPWPQWQNPDMVISLLDSVQRSVAKLMFLSLLLCGQRKNTLATWKVYASSALPIIFPISKRKTLSARYFEKCEIAFPFSFCKLKHLIDICVSVKKKNREVYGFTYRGSKRMEDSCCFDLCISIEGV